MLLAATSFAANAATPSQATDVQPLLNWANETQDTWHGFKRHVFKVNGLAAWVVEPKQPLPGNPWSWCLEFPDAFTERCAAPALLEKGFFHGHIAVGNTFGCPAAVRSFNAFYEALTAKGLSKKPVLIGISRGGLYAYRWASENPAKVAAIYGDAPVCDFKSWPAGKGKGDGSKGDWAELLKCYEFKDEAAALAYPGNPIDVLKPLAEAKVPLIHVVGDTDTAVPVAENTAIVEQRYKALGGTIQVIHKPNVGHHPHGLEDPSPVVNFLLKAVGAGAKPESGSARPKKPNVILVLTDDQGYGDMSCHGNPILRTPAMDTLYRQAVRLTDFHVDPCCSPTRSALMTGRYSSRVGVWHTVLGRSILRANETTMADVFAANGYRTGLFGKWHLGDSYPFRPQDRGFQEALCLRGGAIGNSPDYWGNHYSDDTYFRNGTPETFKGYCTDVWFEEATKYIRANRDRPFFCYLPLNAPHAPLLVPEKYSKPFEGKVPAQRARFYGMLANIDENLGRLRNELRQLGLEDNTIFLFMNDNGTANGADFDGQGNVTGGFNAGMRGSKISEYDGGHRAACFVYWPGGGIDGGRDVDRITAGFDLLPTLIDLCGLTPPLKVKFDGVSLGPLLRNPGKPVADWPERTLFVHNQRVIDPIKGKNYSVMTDRWRCVNGRELYEVKLDPGERNNVAGQHPEVMTELRRAYDRWWNDIAADFDKPARMVIGSDRANPTSLNPHDWIGKPRELFDQSQIRRGRPQAGQEYQGHWLIQVAQDGRYEIEFRRWPRELNQPITAGIPGGTALPATQAKLMIEGIEQTQPVTGEMTGVTFSVDLKAGPATLEGRFIDQKSGQERGPFYVYIKRVS